MPFDFSVSAGQLLSLLLPALVGTGASVSLSGVGSLTLTLLICGLAARSGARLERDRPYDGSAALAALRAAGICAPYAVGNLFLFVVGRWHLSAAQQVSLDAGPSGVGLVLPVLLVAASAGAGAMWRRRSRTSLETSLVRGVAHALLALLVGVVATLALIVLSALAAAVSSRPASSSPGPVAGSGTTSPSVPGGLVLLGIIGVLLYALNALAYGWAANVGFGLVRLGPLGFMIVLGVVAGALTGASFARSAADYVEQAAFVAAFAMASMLLAIASEPTVAGLSTAPSPGSILVIAAVMATAGLAVTRWAAAGRVGDVIRAWPVLRPYARALDALSARVGASPAVHDASAPSAAPTASVSAARRCPRCGAELGAGDRFCGACGTAVPLPN